MTGPRDAAPLSLPSCSVGYGLGSLLSPLLQNPHARDPARPEPKGSDHRSDCRLPFRSRSGHDSGRRAVPPPEEAPGCSRGSNPRRTGSCQHWQQQRRRRRRRQQRPWEEEGGRPAPSLPCLAAEDSEAELVRWGRSPRSAQGSQGSSIRSAGAGTVATLQLPDALAAGRPHFSGCSLQLLAEGTCPRGAHCPLPVPSFGPAPPAPRPCLGRWARLQAPVPWSPVREIHP
mmetsp:Transcript_8892/g.33575  ORF Transcript_8892/g.33575 Transcript_8892/m.33575 type:complete len:230 (+) Transcript_8892:1826-2515(+)